ncbi:helix-turn-helix domain-containing protein [Azotobacter vinelandii]
MSSRPNPTEIKAAREAAGLSQTAAAALVYSGLRTWQQWEAGDRKMHPGLWELFRLKIATLIAHT